MNRKLFIALICLLASTIPALAQETVYPVPPPSEGVPTLLTEDHFGFVVEKSFEYKLTFGYPSMDKAWFVPGTKTRVVMLWLRIENLSQNPIQLDITKIVSTDDTGKTYAPLAADETFNRIMAGVKVTDPTLASKAINRVSLGKAGNKATAEQIKEDVVRYGLQSGPIAPRTVKDGLLYFEAPKKKKYTLTVKLGDLWSKPFTFSTSKPK